MARVFITGSSTGLGLMAATLLVEQGHNVVLHARDNARAKRAAKALPKADAILEGNVTTIAGTQRLAEQANRHGPFDAVIHNVGIGYREPQRIQTADGLSHVFAINTLAPYILTALMEPPKRLVYMSSGLHRDASANLEDLNWKDRRWNGLDAYSETKLHDVMLAFAISRRWPGTYSNALEPGWVATRMGGSDAPDDLDQAHRTQVWLAVSNDPLARGTGRYFYHMRPCALNPEATNVKLQDRLIEACEKISGIKLA